MREREKKRCLLRKVRTTCTTYLTCGTQPTKPNDVRDQYMFHLPSLSKIHTLTPPTLNWHFGIWAREATMYSKIPLLSFQQSLYLCPKYLNSTNIYPYTPMIPQTYTILPRSGIREKIYQLSTHTHTQHSNLSWILSIWGKRRKYFRRRRKCIITDTDGWFIKKGNVCADTSIATRSRQTRNQYRWLFVSGRECVERFPFFFFADCGQRSI